MSKFLVITVVIGGLMLGLSFGSCTKKEVTEVDNETQSVIDCAIAGQEFSAMISAVYRGAAKTKGMGLVAANASSCDTLTYVSGDTTDFIPNPIYLLNVSGPCVASMSDGKARSGRIQVRLTGSLKNNGSQMILKLQDYAADGITFSCDSMVLALNQSGSPSRVFNVKLINGAGKATAYSLKYVMEQTASVSVDGSLSLYGSASGVNRQGRSYSVSVSSSTPLIKNNGCAYFSGGFTELIPDGFKARSVDFGDGSCDDRATYSVNENKVAFKLK